MTRGPEQHDSRRAWLVAWLACVAFMVFTMIVIGGLTRLTGSGLSMVDWRPITGWLPPMTDAEWRAVFDAYRRFPEYHHVNTGMTLPEFKGIFWLEYIHRLWGRLIGVVFFVPFVMFAIRGWIDRALASKLSLLFILGGLQGLVGWLMVKSGLVDRPEVSHFRLAAHFLLALAIYGGLVWMILALVRPRATIEATPPVDNAAPRRTARVICGLVFATACYGAFVAGLDAGLAFNTFPLMDGRIIPVGVLSQDPWYGNFFNNIATVQFLHRLLALVTAGAILLFAWQCRPSANVSPRLGIIGLVMLVWVVVQVGLGATTVVFGVPIVAASAHQAGGLILWSLSLWGAYEAEAGRRRWATVPVRHPEHSDMTARQESARTVR